MAHFTDGSIDIQNIEADAMSLCRRGRAYGEQDEAIIMYSSGSTSEPKGTILTVENIIESVKEKSIEYSVAQNDVFMTWMSLEHIVGWWTLCSYHFLQAVHAFTRKSAHFYLIPGNGSI